MEMNQNKPIELEPLYLEVDIKTGPHKGTYQIDMEMALDVILEMEKDMEEVPKDPSQPHWEPSMRYKVSLRNRLVEYGVLPQGFPIPIAYHIRNAVIDRLLDLKKNIEDFQNSYTTTQDLTPPESPRNSGLGSPPISPGLKHSEG